MSRYFSAKFELRGRRLSTAGRRGVGALAVCHVVDCVPLRNSAAAAAASQYLQLALACAHTMRNRRSSRWGLEAIPGRSNNLNTNVSLAKFKMIHGTLRTEFNL